MAAPELLQSKNRETESKGRCVRASIMSAFIEWRMNEMRCAMYLPKQSAFLPVVSEKLSATVLRIRENWLKPPRVNF